MMRHYKAAAYTELFYYLAECLAASDSMGVGMEGVCLSAQPISKFTVDKQPILRL